MTDAEKCPWVAVGNNIVLREVVQRDKGLVILPDTAKRDVRRLEVVSAGPDCKSLRVGDHILPAAGMPCGTYSVDGVQWFITSEEFVAAVWADARPGPEETP